MKKVSASGQTKHLRAFLLGSLALIALPRAADAQAWVEGKGALSASATYVGATSDDLVDPNGKAYGGADLSITNHTLTLGLEYVPMAKLGLSFDLPLLAVKYGGEQDGVFPPHGEYDDGKYHYTPTDARVGLRYQFLKGLRAISPHVAMSVPVADYPTTGFAGAGRHIIKAHLGLSAGIVLDPWVPNLYIHGTGEYTIGAKVKVDDPMFASDALDEYSQNAMDFNFQVGYFITDKFSAAAVVGAHFQQDGVTLNQVPFGAGADQEVLFKWHDAVLDESYIHPGVDLSYNLTDALSVSGHFRIFASGTNTRNLIGGGFGLSYTILEPKLPDYADDWDDEVGVDASVDANVDANVDADTGDEAGGDESSDDEGADDAPADESEDAASDDL